MECVPFMYIVSVNYGLVDTHIVRHWQSQVYWWVVFFCTERQSNTDIMIEVEVEVVGSIFVLIWTLVG